MAKFLLTSESVCPGHPDKICDQISDAILDDLLAQDPFSRVAVECAVKSSLVFIFGEVSTRGFCDTTKVARDVFKRVGFDFQNCSVISSISEQSPQIAQKIDKDLAAGDQGMMFGFACRETPQLMPLPISLAHDLARRLTVVREEGICPFLLPDGKSQVTVEFENGQPKRVHTVLISAQHVEGVEQSDLRRELFKHVVQSELKPWLDDETIFHCNPSGKFTLGGPEADAGLTGRKIIVDTYGGACPHGGGCFSGKDATKVDRSGALAARHAAKNLVAAGLCDKCQIQISFAIGLTQPLAICVESFGTSRFSNEKLERIVREFFPLTPKEIIEKFSLRQPMFQQTATFGHFGRDEFSWEQTDLAATLQKKFL